MSYCLPSALEFLFIILFLIVHFLSSYWTLIDKPKNLKMVIEPYLAPSLETRVLSEERVLPEHQSLRMGTLEVGKVNGVFYRQVGKLILGSEGVNETSAVS